MGTEWGDLAVGSWRDSGMPGGHQAWRSVEREFAALEKLRFESIGRGHQQSEIATICKVF